MHRAHFDVVADVDQRHWWFLGRRTILRELLGSVLPGLGLSRTSEEAAAIDDDELVRRLAGLERRDWRRIARICAVLWLAIVASVLAGVATYRPEHGVSLVERLQGKTPPAFHYADKGNLAIIGRNAGVADFGRFHVAGFPAWILWLFVHIYYLIGFDNKLLVLFQWAWNYVTRKRGAQLIPGRERRHQGTDAG